ncbi:hypothetical protein BDZ89DRAFT_1087541 [Hymenopellis radicata]|nr:hypothetical protein BDZ89DRAFT_1087541 [Hymenopellis radicata]
MSITMISLSSSVLPLPSLICLPAAMLPHFAAANFGISADQSFLFLFLPTCLRIVSHPPFRNSSVSLVVPTSTPQSGQRLDEPSTQMAHARLHWSSVASVRTSVFCHATTLCARPSIGEIGKCLPILVFC